VKVHLVKSIVDSISKRNYYVLFTYRQNKENDKECAIKKMELPENMALMSDREKMTLDAVRKEICALKLLKHPNIVKLYDVKKL